MITGATRGIGKAISLALAKKNIHVILVYVSSHALFYKTN